MKKLRILIDILVFVALPIAALLWFFPLPSRVRVTFHGVELNESHSITDTGDIIIDGWKLDYLFKTDEFKFRKFQVLDTVFSAEADNTLAYMDDFADYERILGFCWSDTEHSGLSVYFFLHNEGKNCYIELDDSRYAGSTTTGFDPLTVLEAAGVYIPSEETAP